MGQADTGCGDSGWEEEAILHRSQAVDRQTSISKQYRSSRGPDLRFDRPECGIAAGELDRFFEATTSQSLERVKSTEQKDPLGIQIPLVR
jgi:hypothetical protein